jgi:hypothetical protein
METINQPATLLTTMQWAEKFTEIATHFSSYQVIVSLAIFSHGVGGRRNQKCVFHIFMHKKMFSGKICSANNVPKEAKDSIPLYQRYG